MKKKNILAIILAVVMVFSMAACGGGGETNNNSNSDNSNTANNEPNTGKEQVVVSEELIREATIYWSDDWYGHWKVTDGDGYYYDEIGISTDCCLRIVEDSNPGEFIMTIYDEINNDYYSDYLCELRLELDFDVDGASNGKGKYGRLVSVDNEKNVFWGEYVGAGEFEIISTPDGLENMLIIEEDFYDENDDWCEYGIVVTRWNHEWDESLVDAPYYYDDYFLPLMDEGEWMPDEFYPEGY